MCSIWGVLYFFVGFRVCLVFVFGLIFWVKKRFVLFFGFALFGVLYLLCLLCLFGIVVFLLLLCCLFWGVFYSLFVVGYCFCSFFVFGLCELFAVSFVLFVVRVARCFILFCRCCVYACFAVYFLFCLLLVFVFVWFSFSDCVCVFPYLACRGGRARPPWQAAFL